MKQNERIGSIEMFTVYEQNETPYQIYYFILLDV